MILFLEYRADLLDHFRDADDNLFSEHGLNKTEIMENKALIDEFWITYQKDVDEYKVPPYQSFRQILADRLNIPEPESYDDDPACGTS